MSRARELSELPNGVDVDANGNVGIGTNTPSGYNSKLAVLGNIAMANTQSRFYPYYISSTNHAYVSSTAGGDLTFGTGLSGVSERMKIDTAGRVTTPNQPAFLAGIASAADETYSPGQAITFNATQVNTGNHFNTSNGKFTAPVAGAYMFNYGTLFTNSGGNTQSMQISLNVNGSYPAVSGGDVYSILGCTPNSLGGNILLTSSLVLYLAANDVVDIRNRSGNNLRIYKGHTYFSGHLIG